MEEPQPQKGFRNLIDPGAGFGAFVGKLGDALEKAIDRPLGYAVNWGRHDIIIYNPYFCLSILTS